jgi:hypothetical protein
MEVLFITLRLVSQYQMTILCEKFQILASESKEKYGRKVKKSHFLHVYHNQSSVQIRHGIKSFQGFLSLTES